MKKTIVHPDIKNFTVPGYDSIVSEKNGKTTLVLRPKDWDFPMARTVSFRDVANRHNMTNSPCYYTISVKADGAVYYTMCYRSISRSGRRVYTTVHREAYVAYVDGKAKYSGPGAIGYLVMLIILHRRLEALLAPEYRDIDAATLIRDCTDSALVNALSCKKVLAGVLAGRITNRHALMSRVMSTGYGLKGVSTKTIDQFLRYYGPQEIADIRDFTTNPEAAMLRKVEYRSILKQKDPEKVESLCNWRNLFDDLLRDAAILDKRINPKWSLSRMRAEHQKNIKAIMEWEVGTKDETNIYGEAFSTTFQGYDIETVSSCREAFIESKDQHNCLYYGYWKSIAKGGYVAFRISDGKGRRYTAGARRNTSTTEDAFVFDQIYAAYNNRGEGWEEAHGMFKAFIDFYQKDLLQLGKKASGEVPVTKKLLVVRGENIIAFDDDERLPF